MEFYKKVVVFPLRMVYEPREDSYLLQKYVKKFAKGKVLDIGTGSGIQAITAAKKKNVSSVLAVDVNPDAVSFVKNKIKSNKHLANKVKIRISNLFSSVKGKFDTVIFNPPYLPQDKELEHNKEELEHNKELEDKSLYGGKKGYEILERFLTEVGDYLTENGNILIVFSSLTNKERIDAIISQNLLEYRELGMEKLFFEELFCYKIIKNCVFKKINKKICDLRYFSRGKRGIIYTGTYRGEKVAIKTKRKESHAKGRLENEAKWLRLLNKKNIGPSLLFYDKSFIVYRFVEGEFILDFIEKNKKTSIKTVLRRVIEQCFILDKLKVQKEEMHRPIKHIIIGKNGNVANGTVTLLDFERCYKTEKPHNVTQFVEFLCRIKPILAKKKFTFTVSPLRKLAKEYSGNKIRKNLDDVVLALK